MKHQKIIKMLKEMADPEKIKLKRDKFGIVANNSLGIYQADLKIIAKEIGQNDALAFALYHTGIYEARILCSKILSPAAITENLMDTWVGEFENWEICDSFCMGFFAKSQYALDKALEWSSDEREFVKRAGFVMMACYGFADKKASNRVFKKFLPIIVREATDQRIYVKKAVNWALRNIGKRNIDLHRQAILTANKILKIDSKTAKWIASNALKELEKPGVNILDYPREIYR